MKNLRQLIIVIVFFLAGHVAIQGQFINEQGLKFVKLFGWIDSYYVDTVNLSSFSDDVIRELLHKLDPHSAYLTKEEVKEANEQLQGNFEGIGITFNVLNDTIFVVSTVADGPSAKVGVKAGDRIIEIDTKNVAGVGISNREILSQLKGKKGTSVTIKIIRRGEGKPLNFTIVRDKIPINSVDAHYIVDRNTGYIKLSRFSITTMSEILEILAEFKNERIENLIIDLSGNGGGYLDVAVSLADELLEPDKLIVFTKGVHSEKKEYYSTINGVFEKGKLVIIIDENSASASEIVAGAIQDWDRGIVVGRRSFGKGLVQRPFNFPDGSVARLTVARYYTPSGRLIQKSYSGGFEAYSNEVRDRFVKNNKTDSTKIADSLKYYTLMRKRPVYGGGGITPDIHVPVDTTGNTSFYRKVMNKGIVSDFALIYVDTHREKLHKQYPTFRDFKINFKVDAALQKEFLQYAQKNTDQINQEEFERAKEIISRIIKANIASDIWGQNEFYEIVNTGEASFSKALEIINNWDNYLSLITP
jgi:carboxyl-terminal processing protease